MLLLLIDSLCETFLSVYIINEQEMKTRSVKKRKDTSVLELLEHTHVAPSRLTRYTREEVSTEVERSGYQAKRKWRVILREVDLWWGRSLIGGILGGSFVDEGIYTTTRRRWTLEKGYVLLQ